MKAFLYSLLFITVLSAWGEGIPESEREAIVEELKEPITLVLKNGQKIEGHPIEIAASEMKIASAEDAGEIIFTFNYQNIESIEVPGESYKVLTLEWIETGDDGKALDLMNLLYQQRKSLLPILPASESNFFVLYLPLILDSPDPARAIGVSRQLRPQIENPEALRALDDATLESYLRLEMFDEAVKMARHWVEERDPYGNSALGYYVLGSEHLRLSEYESAIDLALRPIVFSSIIPTDKLSHCYALAASAAFAMREREYAVQLYNELHQRGFAWPENDSTLKPYQIKIQQYLSSDDEE